jgi:hypothetical protein
MTSNTETIKVDDSDPRDPNAKCDRCGTTGTIARAVRHTADQLMLRYCGRCWPLASEEMEKQRREEDGRWQEAERAWMMTRGRGPADATSPRPSPPPTWSSSSRSWYDTRRFLTLIQQPGKGGPTATPEIFAKIAADIRAAQSEMEGPVPPEIKEFLDRYAP